MGKSEQFGTGVVQGVSTGPWPVIHSSDNHKWRTPLEVFEPLHREFAFSLDAAASDENRLCEAFIGEDQDALGPTPWTDYITEDAHLLPTIWLNPPYGRTVGQWIERADREAQRGCVVACLVSACTDTKWWAAWAWKASEIRFVVGRIKFIDHEGNRKAAARMGSSIVIFRPDYLRPNQTNPFVTLQTFHGEVDNG